MKKDISHHLRPNPKVGTPSQLERLAAGVRYYAAQSEVLSERVENERHYMTLAYNGKQVELSVTAVEGRKISVMDVVSAAFSYAQIYRHYAAFAAFSDHYGVGADVVWQRAQTEGADACRVYGAFFGLYSFEIQEAKSAKKIA